MNKQLNLNLYLTKSVGAFIEESDQFKQEVNKAALQFLGCDWGDLCEDDKLANDHDLLSKDGHILGKYNTCKGAIYIESEDFENALIMFPGER